MNNTNSRAASGINDLCTHARINQTPAESKIYARTHQSDACVIYKQ
jgi:hypothetical protein